MKVMYSKHIYDIDCPKRFSASLRGHVACCEGMSRLLNNTLPLQKASNIGFDQVKMVSIDTHTYNGITKPYINLLNTGTISFCPFCGEKHEVIEVTDNKVNDEDDK